jgi:hypothetical protein
VRHAALLLTSYAAIAAVGCGGTGHTTNPTQLRFERQDLVAVTRALERARASVSVEVAATRAAWPLIAHGLPAATASVREPVGAAAAGAARLEVPAILQEAQQSTLTGPGAGLASLFRSFDAVAPRSWRMIAAAIGSIEHGSQAAARFARANVALYIESVYNAHFVLAQIGKPLLSGYHKLGGGAAFGGSLSDSEVSALAAAYSQTADVLQPHVAAHLGS